MAAPPAFQTYKNQVPLGQGQTLGFQTGRGYYAKGLAQAAAGGPAAPQDPYSQLTGYQPLTQAQILAQAQGEISPMIQAITGQATSQAGQAASQIQGLTSDYANELGQINMAAPYQAAEGQQSAVDAALQQSLTGQGSSLAGGLTDRLSQLQGSSGQAALDQAAGQLSGQGAANGTTQLASGSAALSNLIANAAAGGEFGAKLPAIARLSGLQALGENSSQQQQNVANATLQTESQLPSLIQDLTANNQTGLSDSVAAQQKQQALNFENAVKDAALGQGQQKIGISQQNANTSASRASAAAQAAMTRAAIAQENATTAADRAKSDAAYKTAQLKLKQAQGSTPKITATTLRDAGRLAQDLYHGVTKPTAAGGTEIVSYSQTYQDAVKTMVSQYPELGMKQVMNLVNRWYPAGEFGRPKAPARGTVAPSGFQAGTYGKALSTPANPGGYLPKGK